MKAKEKLKNTHDKVLGQAKCHLYSIIDDTLLKILFNGSLRNPNTPKRDK